MNKIIAVGGTGQLIIHYYLQLYLLGLVREPADILVVDTDKVNAGIESARDFLSSVDGFEVSRLRMVAPARPRNTGYQILTGLDSRPGGVSRPHPVDAYFSADSLDQNLLHGLFARPALSSVLLDVEDDAFAADPNAHVVMVGSIIGGTGGGMLAPCLDRARKVCRTRGVKIQTRALLIGEYFQADPARIEPERLRSNQTMVLKATKDAFDDLQRFVLIGGPGNAPVPRDPELEKGVNVAWPGSSTHPLWLAVEALDYLLKDNVTDFDPNFEQRQSYPTPRFSIQFARERLHQSTSLCNALVKHSIGQRIASEPACQMFWGRRLPRLIDHFWSIAAERNRDVRSKFPTLLDDALRNQWTGRAERPGLKGLFPLGSSSPRTRPGDVANHGWPSPSDGEWRSESNATAETTATRAAATMIFSGLRGGE